MMRSIPLHFSDGEYVLKSEEDGKFTLLRELFEGAPDRLISIDLKADSDVLKLKVSDLIKEFKRESITIWGSVKPKHHTRIREVNPEVPQFYSAAQTLLVYVLYYLGLLFLYPLPSDAFMVPIMTKHKVRLFGKILKNRGSGIFVKMLFLVVAAMVRNSRGLYRHLRARGVLVVLWVANEDEEYLEAAEIFGDDIDGIMTDRPQALWEWVKTH